MKRVTRTDFWCSVAGFVILVLMFWYAVTQA